MKKITLALFVLIFLMHHQPAIGQEPSGVVIDEVVAVVGKEYILLSDIEQQYLQMRMQESVQESEEYTKCLILENLLFEKLLLHQAELDSVVITQDQVNAELDRRMRYFISQFGSQEKLEQFYNKTVTEFKSDLSEVIEKQMMVENVQQTITEHVDVSPAEVRKYFREIPHDSIPLISSVVELAEIVKKPVISPEEKHQVRERLKKYRERVINGESFEALAVLYSEDPGSARQGGDIGLRGRGELYPEFETIAFQLDPGEVSDIVETEAGFHIIQGIERRGDFVRVRHILLKPRVSPEELDKARVFLDSIAELIRTDSLKFDDAVVKFSTDPSRNNNGIMINPNTGGSQWSLDELDPKMFFVIDKLEVGQISTPVVMEDEDGSEAYRLILLKNRTQPHRANIEDDYDQIQMWALQQKKTETVKKWIKNNSYKAYIRIDENYRSCNFENTWF
ncbi:MAG: peptidylprolyl isomerase [Sphingobacteriia bacterium]|nr:peptidylprolyl isomerase [Sphingobacteriia bacterium]